MKKFILLMTWIIFLCGCEEKPIEVPVSAFNFTEHDINSVWVNGKWAGLARTNEGGGSAGWVTLPRTYKPGTTVTVDWERNACVHATLDCQKRDKNGDILQVTKRKIIQVHPYNSKTVAELQLAFLPNDDVRAYADGANFSYAEHPSREEFGNLLAAGTRPIENQWPIKGGKAGASK
ncbi:DUF3304 domain-containing protein [Chromobacterium violaceum]|uniref:DUF3304 domain-containing protein n=1 Tax=Chromobacterium violaceum TaxID=536 RepID=UPI0009DA8401|nr:DUF3304 domain-containing protein [Chromobacterium violaceum]